MTIEPTTANCAGARVDATAHRDSCGVAKPGAERGIVLLAVLWMVAALSLVVVGMVNATRQETRRTGQTRQTLASVAQIDAALHLALQQLKTKPAPQTQLSFIDTLFDGQSIRVQVQPLNGFIDLNNAPRDLLVALFVHAGKMERAAAEALATNLVVLRSRKDARGSPIGFEAVEDLLGVPGVDYALYASIKNFVTTDVRSSGRVNALAAPVGVLTVLADGNAQKAATIAAGRDAGAVGVDTTALNPAFVDGSATQRVQLQAALRLPDGSTLVYRRSVDLSPSAREGTPWRTFRAEHWVEPAALQ